jgi:hypothetical protein
MLLLFKELHKLPKNILFLSGPRLDIPGSRWIPTSLIAVKMATKAVSQYFHEVLTLFIHLKVSNQHTMH